MSDDLLLPFCGRNDHRAWLNQPWTLGGMRCATNGKVLVVLDTVDATKPDTPGLPQPDQLRKLVAQTMDAAGPWHPIEPVQFDPCSQCEGSGKVRSKECPDCDGDGEFWHGNHTYDCRECEGTGWLIGGPDDDEIDCPSCGGTAVADGGWQPEWIKGGKWPYPPKAWGIGHRPLSLIRKLAGVEFCKVDDVEQGIPFRFTGGRGLVMPRRQR